ncbi:cyclic AMP-dependent transcription factor ATF-2, partial [Tachysurus ichikawai]
SLWSFVTIVVSIHMSSTNQIQTSPQLRMDMYSGMFLNNVKLICSCPKHLIWMRVSCLLSLQNEVTVLRNEVAQLKQLLLAHKDCPVTLMQKKSGFHLLDKEDSSEEMSVPGSPHNEAIQHSSVSTSNGVSSSTASGSATGPTTDQSTEGEESSAAPATHTQPTDS